MVLTVEVLAVAVTVRLMTWGADIAYKYKNTDFNTTTSREHCKESYFSIQDTSYTNHTLRVNGEVAGAVQRPAHIRVACHMEINYLRPWIINTQLKPDTGLIFKLASIAVLKNVCIDNIRTINCNCWKVASEDCRALSSLPWQYVLAIKHSINKDKTLILIFILGDDAEVSQRPSSSKRSSHIITARE